MCSRVRACACVCVCVRARACMPMRVFLCVFVVMYSHHCHEVQAMCECTKPYNHFTLQDCDDMLRHMKFGFSERYSFSYSPSPQLFFYCEYVLICHDLVKLLRHILIPDFKNDYIFASVNFRFSYSFPFSHLIFIYIYIYIYKTRRTERTTTKQALSLVKVHTFHRT